jgi:hypothetical protein
LRIKSHWFKGGQEKAPDEIGGAMAFILYRIGLNALKNMRQAGFDIAVGDQYFEFLTEFQIYLVQIADRLAYTHFQPDDRRTFTVALANRVAETQAENQSDLLGGLAAEHKNNFIEQLNLRAGDYAEFDYSVDGGKFAFIRYLAHCINDIVDQKDKSWVVDQITAIEGPEAADMVEKSMQGLLDTESKPRSSSRVSGGD